ncbi:MAG TPA: Ig-like domain-containing protein [Bosea sp. (in: a-proteobacteria)]|uniref:Ig-like domain-containing protein n=1 Tax=Bosea sp. (in: a-proteobacteria) TaxID=1871050 RepID=UPI002E0D1DF1|nr:Ig-like domain-containing protein [Bosea sp. (in: a-proteobacteria)]
MADQPVLYAHRGTNPYTDNETDAYKWAFKYGADFIEIDLRLTKDGELVSYHDDLPGGIANMTYAEVKAAVPGIITFDEIIALTKQMELETGRKLGILVETKSTGYSTYDAMLADLVAADFADPERIVFQTFATDHKVLRDLMDNKYDVDFPLVWLTDNITDAKIANATNPQGTMGELDGLAPQMALINKDTVAAAQAAGLKVNGWTVAGTEADVQNALNLGVDGIINDNTQLARPALEKLLNGRTVVYGTDQGSEINGGTDKDVIYAMSGDDIVRGGVGDDLLYGDAGNDLLFGGAGNDELVGGSGSDYLEGGTGSDILTGGAGNDVIVATGDKIVFRTGDGIDLVSLDATSTIVFDGVTPASVSVIRDGNNLIIRAGNDALVLLNGVDPAHQPASITTTDGFTLTGAELAALAVDGTDAEVAAVLPGLQDVLANAPAFAIPSTVTVGTDLVAAGDFPEGTLSYDIPSVESGAVYRLSFSLADLPTGNDGVRVLWGGQVVYEGIPSAAGDKLHFMLKGGAGNGSNDLVFEGAGGSFAATLDDLRLVKVADPVMPVPGNVAPETEDTDLTTSQNVAFNGKVVATDANGDQLTYSLGDGPANGTLVFNADGTYKYTPAAGFSGTDSFSYLVNDGHGGIVESVVSFNVAQGILLGTDLMVNGSFEDLSESSGNNGANDWGYRNQDGQIVGWTNVNNKRIEQHWDNYGGIVAKDGRIWIDMDHSQTGTTVDRIGQSIAHVEEGATYKVSFSLSDSDRNNYDDGVIVLWNGEVIFDGLPPQTSASWTTLNFEVKGGSGNGTNRLEFIDKGVTDSWGAGTALDDVRFVKIANAGDILPANQAPVAVDGQAQGMKDTLITGQLSASDQDAGTVLIYSLAEGPAHGTVFVYTDGTYRYTPTAGFSGADSFTYLVDDGRGGKDTATIDLTVKSSTSQIAIGTDLIINGSFEDISESSGYNGGADWGYRNLDGQILGWTNANFKRIEQHLDNYGGVVAKDGKFWIDMDGAGQTARNKIGQTISLAEEGATYRVSFSLSDSDTGRFDDGIVVLWNGEVIFDGLPPQTGASWVTLSFEVKGGSGNGSNRLEFMDTGVKDSWGAGVALDDVHFVKIADAGDVLPVNHAPTAADSEVAGLKDTLVTGQVSASDQDAGASLIFSLKQGPSHGTVFVYSDGTYRYTPATGFTGEDSFTVLVDDGRGGKTEATVSLTIAPPNAAPVAGNDSGFGTAYGAVLAIDPATLLANDSDANGDALAILSVAALSGGTVLLDAQGKVVFTPAAGFSGEALFSYTVSDGKGGTATATVTVTVAPYVPVGTPGDDELAGTVGDDVIQAGDGDDMVRAGAGNDTVEGGEGDDELHGEAGDDTLVGGAGDDELVGGDGDDVLKGGAGDDLLDGGEGIDAADYSDDTAGVTVNLAEGLASGAEIGVDELISIETVIGGAGDDVLIGDDGDNRFVASAGHDLIDGGAGFDTLDLSAATGPVSVDFAGGKASGAGIGTTSFVNIEKLLFGTGDDVVTGGNGDDAFDGGAGHDTLKGGAGDDSLWGGAGNDTLDGGSGHDAVYGGTGNDVIKAGSGDDRVEAGEGDDSVDAGSGDDIVLGGAGHDVIDGGSGDDRIEGGAGDDSLTGGSGHDVFVFAQGFGKDTITDFRTTGASSDVLEFSIGLFADFDAAMEAADQLGADTVFTIDADTTLTLKGVQLASLSQDDFRFV